MTHDTVTAAIVTIGDEILSGRTQDTNMNAIANFLAPLGVQVREARVVPDVHEKIVSAVKALASQYDYVFTTGGIGPTHDDITADAIASAFGRPIGIREDARKILEDWYRDKDTPLTDARLRMARIPEGAELIANPVSGAPGFRLENVHVFAGVPRIMKAMLANVGPTLRRGVVEGAITVRAPGMREGDVAQALRELADAMPGVGFGSYPWFEAEGETGVAFVARSGDGDALKQARSRLEALCLAHGVTPSQDSEQIKAT